MHASVFAFTALATLFYATTVSAECSHNIDDFGLAHQFFHMKDGSYTFVLRNNEENTPSVVVQTGWFKFGDRNKPDMFSTIDFSEGRLFAPASFTIHPRLFPQIEFGLLGRAQDGAPRLLLITFNDQSKVIMRCAVPFLSESVDSERAP